MTIDEAIKHLKSLHDYWDCYYEKREATALELGIEALKTIKMFRKFADDDNIGRLPGETRSWKR